jgi:hypothetical protein
VLLAVDVLQILHEEADLVLVGLALGVQQYPAGPIVEASELPNLGQ